MSEARANVARMANYLDSIAPAVATIVQHTAGYIVHSHQTAEDKEKALLAYTDKLARTFAKALLDANAGKIL